MTNPPTSKGPETFAEAARRLLQRMDAGKKCGPGCAIIETETRAPARHLCGFVRVRLTVVAATAHREFEQPQPQRLGEAGTKTPRLGFASPQARRLELYAHNDNVPWVLPAGAAVFDAVDFAGQHHETS